MTKTTDTTRNTHHENLFFWPRVAIWIDEGSQVSTSSIRQTTLKHNKARWISESEFEDRMD